MKKNMLVTGPTNGIGKETALALAAQGHKLFLLCRNAQAGKLLCDEIAALPGSQPAVLMVADLGNMDQVRAVAETFLASGAPLHVLINNAGVINTERLVVNVAETEQEQMFAVNYLGHYLLTRLLLPRLLETAKKDNITSRLVVVSSDAHALFCKGMDFDDLNHSKKFSAFKVYGRSKLANIMMVKELAKHVDKNLLQVNCLHPGAVSSNLGVNNSHHWYSNILTFILSFFFITPAKGAATSLYLATEDIDTQGEYYYRCKIHRLKPWAKDEATQKKLWDVSASLLNLAE
ncbi:MAG: SDR family NAD(P)-dependent oxidoreductase [Pseudomonadales bacterium]|nr:SDR family NAD(P)-dependent oxidoreductase [Pseudomonadales bacterium]